MRRWLLVGVAGVALAGCSQRSDTGSAPAEPAARYEAGGAPQGMVVQDRAAAPGIDVTAAPGVAFTYRYGFRLPSDRIAGVQEAHAQACEKLGIARCRITGMRYRLLGENNIEGELEFKLDPTLARGFGKSGIVGVEAAGGTLVDAAITGTDAGATIDRAAADRARAADELRRLDEAIARARSGTERAELQAQRAEIARRIAAATDTGNAARDSLATTPVTFLYGSGPAVRGFDTSAPITSALDTAVGSAQVTLAIVLALLAVLGPPALVAGLVVWLVLLLRRRRRASAVPVPDTPAD
jgi:hypothetical protein